MRMQVYIGNTEVFIDEQTRPVITKQFIDIQNPENTKSDRTLTFTMPGTPVNDSLFGKLFNVNLQIQNTSTTQFNPDFNPNLKASFRLVVDTIPNLTGYCQLTSINLTRENTIRYEIVAWGVTSDLFATIGDSLVSELDFSEYNHTWNATNVANSWDTSIVVNGGTQAFALGTGYVYPMIDYGLNTTPVNWKVTEFFPSIYAKEYWDKIFEAAGFTYTSNFLTSERFKRLVIPYTGQELKLTDADAQARLFQAERITSNEILDVLVETSPGNLDLNTYNPMNFNQTNTDPSGQWGGSSFSVINTGKYIFQASLTFGFYNNSGSAINTIDTLTAGVAMFIIRGGAVVQAIDAVTPSISPGTFNNATTTSTAIANLQYPEIQLYAGDSVVLAPVYITSQNLGGGSTTFFQGDGIQFVNAVGSIFQNQVGSDQIVQGDTIAMNSTLPVDFKQKDFLVGIIRMFNLYMQPDPDNENALLIEPRDDYYTSEVEDWTYKLDEDQPFKIQPMGLLDSEQYTFQYTEDTDYLNGLHQQRYGFSYGRRRYVVNNQFVTQDKVIQPSFAPTPLYAPQSYSKRIVSQIEFVDQQGKPSVKASKPRILYYGGLLSAGNWVLNSVSPSGISASTKTTYPYAGHLDNPYAPTFDINYGAPKEIYYGAAFASQGVLQYTENNLYKAYWQKYIEEITNKDSKVVTGFFYLDPKDVYSLSFRKLYLIKDAYYRLLRVNNYDPISNAPCECEFLKIQEVPQSAAVTENFYGGTGTIGADDLPIWDLPKYKDDNVYNPREGQAIILGDSNLVGGDGTVIFLTGSGNLVGGGIDRATILGSDSNQILNEGVVIINSSGQVVTEADTTIIGDIRYPKRFEVTVSSAEMLAIGATPVTVLLAPGTGRFLEAINVYARRQNSTIGYSSQTIVLQYITSGINAASFATELLTATGNGMYKATIATDLTENNGFQLTTQSGADPTLGDGDFIFYIDLIYQNI